MKIAIVWYGRMWKLVEQHALEKWDEISIIIDPLKNTTIHDLVGVDFDVIIEFCIPKVAMENLEFYANNNYRVIMATTGWYNNLTKVKEMFKNSNWALLWSGNFSLWVNLFWKILEKSSKIMNNFPDYDVFWHEYHHKNKTDSPSWTLINTWDIILNNIKRKNCIVTDTLKDRPIKDEELHLTSTRGWAIPWTHQIFFDSLFDTIEIKHTARTRDWFAIWAIKCAEWLKDKQGYYEIKDFMKYIS